MNIELFNLARSLKARMRTHSVLLIAAPLLLMPAVTFASNGVIAFHGQVSNSTCVVLPSTTVMLAHASASANNSPQITVMVDTSRNACGQQAIPFSTRFTLLPAVEGQVSFSGKPVPQGRAGVLTMSYE